MAEKLQAAQAAKDADAVAKPELAGPAKARVDKRPVKSTAQAMMGVAHDGKDVSKMDKDKAETKEEHEVEEELNSILKRSPSTALADVTSQNTADSASSHHLLQDLLPPLGPSEEHPAREV